MNTETHNIDFQAVERLRSLLGNEFVPMMQVFLQDAAGYVRDMENAIRAGKLKDMQASAHKLRSTSGQIGLARIQQIAEKCEYSNDIADEALLALHAELAETLIQVEHVLKSRYLAA